MFEWLEQEIKLIRNRKFHMVDGPADQALREAIENSDLPVPRSYKEFVLRFGNARLYRQLDYYKIGVLASPREEIHQETGEIYFRFGHYDSSSAYFKESLMHGEEETPVLEGRGGGFQQVADNFEAWLTKRRKTARGKYNKRQWAEIVAGPPPFTPEEHRIVEARKQFIWRVVGITPDRNFLLEVHNGSKMMLPFLSIGVRRKNSSPFGGIWVPVSHIYPGQTLVVECDAYKNMVDPRDIELFPEPDPEPEDRERYWEFQALSP